jgi:replicative DNA helicase
MSVYNFERRFRLKIIANMLNNMWMAKYGNAIILPEYFESEDEVTIVKTIRDYRDAYNKSPIDSDDLTALAGPEYGELINYVYDLYESGECELAADEALKFAKQQAVKLAILEGVDDINKGDLDTPIVRMQEALKIGDNLLSTGIDPILDSDKWLFTYYDTKVATGQYHLDTALDGGLSAGELGIIMSGINVGKSMELINLGVGAASIPNGKNVVHFTHEMRPAQVAKRYAARMLFRFPQREDNLIEYQDDLYEKARRLLKGKIRIIGGAYKMTTVEFESHMDRLIGEGYEPGVIIDDYLDLMQPPKHYSERRFELSAIYEWARATGEKYNCPFWTATQSNRGAYSKEVIGIADIAEDIGKAAIADVLIALCQSYDELQLGQCRFFIAKNRDAPKQGKSLIGCKYYGASQAIITTDFVKRKGEENTEDA